MSISYHYCMSKLWSLLLKLWHEAPGYKFSVHEEFQCNLSTHSVDIQCAYDILLFCTFHIHQCVTNRSGCGMNLSIMHC